jgi:hypothetical protein
MDLPNTFFSLPDGQPTFLTYKKWYSAGSLGLLSWILPCFLKIVSKALDSNLDFV